MSFGCLPMEAPALSVHTAVRGSGRVARITVGRAFEEEVVTAAVISAIRDNHAGYDELLNEWLEPHRRKLSIKKCVRRIAGR